MSTRYLSPTKGARLARRARPFLGLYAALLLVVLFSPSSAVQSSLVMDVVRFSGQFLPWQWVDYPRAEVMMNAVIIAPLTFLGAIAFPRLRWQDWTTYAFLGSASVELIQGLLLPARQASFSDIVANTAGALMGALVARVLFRTHLRPQ